MKIIDISLEIKPEMITYPGDPLFRIQQIKFPPKDTVALSEMTMGTHTGTHVDAKVHINPDGTGVDTIPLDRYYGPCKVLDVTSIKFGSGITKDDLKAFPIKHGDIILLKTRNSSTGYSKFFKDFVALSLDGANYLVKKKIKTVGIDYLSIQPYGTPVCEAHCVLLNNDIIVFEGLNLSQVKPGRYLFIGLPLKIQHGDGAPARAILIEK